MKQLKISPLYFLIILSVMLSGCGAPVSSFIRPDQPLPGHLENQPVAKKKIPIQATEVDVVRQLDGNQLLISTLETTGFMLKFVLVDKDLQLLDLAKGVALWKIPLSAFNTSILDLIITPTYVIVVGTDKDSFRHKTIALNRDSGATEWSYIAPTGNTATRYRISENLRHIVFVNSSDGLVNLLSLDLQTGKELWKKSFKGKKNEKDYVPFSVQGIQNIAIVMTDKLTAFNSATGKQVWGSVSEKISGLSDINIVNRGRLIFAYGKHKLLAIDPKQQKVIWSLVAKNGEFIAPVAVGSALLITERNKNKLIIRRIDSKSKKQRWKTVISNARSPVFISGKHFYYTTRKNLIKMDFARGKALARYAIPKYLQTEDGLADRLIKEGRNIIVAREEGVTAYNAKTGRLKYTQAVYGGKAFTSSFLESKLRLRNIARKGGIKDPGELVSAIAQANVDMLYGMSTGYNQANAEAMGYNVSGSSMALASSVQMLGSVLSMSASYRESAVASNLNTNRRQIDASIASQQYSIQHGYYVRPFYNNGWGVTLVRLRDGNRVDLYVTPPNEPLQVNSGNYPLFLIDPEKNQLIAKGLGMRPDASQTYEKVAIDKEVYESWPGIPDNWIIPYASVFVYDLKKLDFRKGKKRLPVLATSIGKKEQYLREAVLSNDLDRVKKLVASGADVNAVDRFGYNILFYAAMMDKTDMVKYLIAKDANATLRDAHGWLAFHYTFMTHGMNATTGWIRDAHLEQNPARLNIQQDKEEQQQDPTDIDML